MYVEDSQLNKFILDSGLVSRVDLDDTNKEAEKGAHTSASFW